MRKLIPKKEAKMTLFSNVLWGCFQRAVRVSNVLLRKIYSTLRSAVLHFDFSTCFAKTPYDRNTWQAAQQHSTSFSIKEVVSICRHMRSQTHTHYRERIGTRFKVLWSSVFGPPAGAWSSVGICIRILRPRGLVPPLRVVVA